MALGELKGIGRTMPNPYLLIRPLQRKEAVASSNIEGTHTSLSDLFLFEAGADEKGRPPDTREVHNYVRAMEHALSRLSEIPVCLRLMREAHEILLMDVQKHRGAVIVPGEFKSETNWIGGLTVQSARFVPPPPKEALESLKALEAFIHDEAALKMPPLLSSAMIHYQFETIHPFPDGNGRLGRLLIPLILCEKQVLTQPLLYMSAYFERHKDEYIDRLFAVSAKGDWLGWIEFFLKGVVEQCQDTVVRIQRVQDIHSDYKARLQQARSSGLALALADTVVSSPVISIPYAQRILGVTYRGAQINIEKLVSVGILREMPVDTRPKFYMADDILQAIHS